MDRRLLLPLLAGLAAAGCRTAPPVEVRIPVPVPCPAPPEVDRPTLAVEYLTPASTDAEIVPALGASVIQLKGYAKQLETILDGYR